MKKMFRSLLSLALTFAVLTGVLAAGGALPALTTSAEAPDYLVVDDCDTTTNFTGGGVQTDVNERMQGKAALRFGGNSTFSVSNGKAFQMDVPEDFANWYLELWLYVDKTTNLTLNKCTLEINFANDTYYRWKFQKLGTLKNGWNKIQVPFSSAGEKNNTANFTQINRIKVTFAATKMTTVYLDDICISRAATARDKSELQETVTRAASFDTTGGSASNLKAFQEAKTRAEAALASEKCSQRDADVAAEVLNDAMNAFGFEGFTLDNSVSYGFVDFAAKTYATLDGFRVAGGDRVTYGERDTTMFTQALYINAAKKQVSADTRALRFTFTYFDGESGGLELHYTSTAGEKTALKVDFTGQNVWRTATVRVDDAALARAIDNADIAIKAVGNATGYVSRVEVRVISADDLAESDPPAFAAQSDTNNVIGAGVFGYQMWFSAGDDGWVHWGEGSHANPVPGNGNHHTDMYPYLQDYIDNGAKLSESGLADLGNGDKALLFTSKDPAVVETHFQWISEYGIDCMAIQRFGCGFQYQVETSKNHLVTAQKMAEKYDKSIYVMYDVTGQGELSYDELYKRITTDFVLNVEQSGVASSPAYAHADGKPVVCIWGISGNAEATNYPSGETASHVIRWFQERGYFVIVGTPDNEFTSRTGTYLEPFTLADMVSPWTVGRYNYSGCTKWIQTNGKRDSEFCKANGVKYQPVMFPGFSWIAMLHSGRPNAYPRMAGEFVWRQAIANKQLDVDSIYFAMFDEYDEGTAYMKGAADSFEIPEKDYFVTYAADGKWLSNDYYLRTAQKVVQLFKGQTEDTKLNIPYSQGPIYWRNSFEKRWTTWLSDDDEGNATIKHTILSNVDVCTPRVGSLDNKNGAVELTMKQYEGATDFLTDDEVVTDTDAYGTSRVGTGVFRDVSRQLTKTGEWAFQFNGKANENGADMKYGIADADIMVSAAGLELSYSLYAVNEGGCRVGVDLMLENGAMLSSQVPAIGGTHGKVGQWVDVSITLPSSLVGQRIKYIAVRYEGAAGDFDAYIDDVILQSPGTEKDMLRTAVKTASALESDSETLAAAIAAGQATLDKSGATKKDYLTAMKAIDTVLRTEGTGKTVYGDVNGDGAVDTADAVLVLQCAAKLIDKDSIDAKAADVNGDGTIDTADAVLILQYAAKLIDKFPVE